MVISCRDDYIKEANKQLKEKTVYKDINFKETILSHLMDRSFKSFCTRKFVMEKELKYFSYDFKKATDLGKLY